MRSDMGVGLGAAAGGNRRRFDFERAARALRSTNGAESGAIAVHGAGPRGEEGFPGHALRVRDP